MLKKHLEYSELILDHYRNPRNSGKLKHRTHQAEIINDLCGDEITVNLAVEHNIIKDISFTSRGCALMTATASVLSEYLKGKKLGEVEKITKSKMEKLLNAKIPGTRDECLTLPLKAIKKALSN